MNCQALWAGDNTYLKRDYNSKYSFLKNFTKLILSIHNSFKNEDKTELILNYLSIAREEDKLWMIYLLSGGKIKRSVSAEILRKCAMEYTGLPVWLFDECLQRTGELAETISLLTREPVRASNYSLSFWIQNIETIRSLMPDEQIVRVTEAWRMLTQKAVFVFNRLISGTIKTTVNEKLLVNALSAHTGLSKGKLAKKLTVKVHMISSSAKKKVISAGGKVL